MTAAVALDICPDCAKPSNQGLCGKDHCRKAVLPQIAKPALVRLIGDVQVEQTKRQKPLAPKEKVAIERIGRRNARRQARSGRGHFGLAKAIMGR